MAAGRARLVRRGADEAVATVRGTSDADLTAKLPLRDNQQKIEARPPTVTAVAMASSPASGTTYGAGETIAVGLRMREDVVVTGTPHVWLEVGGAPRRADYSGPVGTQRRTLEFSYTVQAGDFDSDGVRLCGTDIGMARCGRIHLAGGTIRARLGGVDADLRHPGQDVQAGHKVDGMPPVVGPGAPACSGEIRVPANWALKPSGVSAGGKFRLLFVTSTTHTAQSSDIADYNSYVQNRAGAGHAAIRDFRSGFRVLGSTAAVDARDNTCTTGTGAPIYWLSGNKAADNNADFYDGSWDTYAGRNESGGSSTPLFIFTGSGDNGTEAPLRFGVSQALGGASGVTMGGRLAVVQGRPASPFDGANEGSGNSYPLYGLSQVFVVASSNDPGPSASSWSIVSRPARGSTFRRGETVEIAVVFSEAVEVRGAPVANIALGDDSDTANLTTKSAGYIGGSPPGGVRIWRRAGGWREVPGARRSWFPRRGT